MLVDLARAQDGGRKMGVVDRVGVVLGFQAEADVFGVTHAVLAVGHGVAVDEVARIELDGRLE